MANGVFVHRADSPYDDFPEYRYQFPKRYLNRAKKFIGDWIAYYEPRGGGGRLGYYAIAKVASIIPDPQEAEMYIAQIERDSYRPLETVVGLRHAGRLVETTLERDDGSMNQGLVQWAIRPLLEADFRRILALGFSDEFRVLPREDSPGVTPRAFEGLADDQVPYIVERQPIESIISRIPRDRVFRKLVLDAYDSRCALTGLRLVNGGGRAEVQAAHIRPVEMHGPDTIRNGIALSGTVHWMFDRGLVSLTDNLEILVSRQTNDPDQVWNLLNSSRHALARPVRASALTRLFWIGIEPTVSSSSSARSRLKRSTG